ncbi:MAG TPA: VWA domain-containing protein, partial [Phototrophicaceae bacterium]|nr:VWA domain-containing protein [Phototrophicaceae bacterium]
MQFLTPLALFGALLAIPIILLYMLRLRRREILISSTFLWQQILQDQEANTPWQRLRRNLLLLLQLIILTLLVLALARPFITVPSVSAAQTALLIDASASMNATDGQDGATRLEEAKQRSLEIVDTLSSGSIMTIIRVDTTPEILTPYTGDRERLRQVINDTQPGEGGGDWLTALTLAAEGGRGVEDFSIVIVGDGGLNEG